MKRNMKKENEKEKRPKRTKGERFETISQLCYYSWMLLLFFRKARACETHGRLKSRAISKGSNNNYSTSTGKY